MAPHSTAAERSGLGATGTAHLDRFGCHQQSAGAPFRALDAGHDNGISSGEGSQLAVGGTIAGVVAKVSGSLNHFAALGTVSAGHTWGIVRGIAWHFMAKDALQKRPTQHH